MSEKITIDGTEYNLAELSDVAKKQIFNIAMAEKQIRVEQERLMMFRSARALYAATLKKEISTKNS